MQSYSVNAQDDAIADSLYESLFNTYKVKFDSASQFEGRVLIDSLFIVRGEEMEGIYNQYPDTDSGKKALHDAFMGMMTADSLERMAVYLEQISSNDDIWHILVKTYNYALNNRRVEPSYYYNYLMAFHGDEKVTNPISKSFINSELGSLEFRFYENIEAAKEHFLTVIELNAYVHHVEGAKRDLYDITQLKVGSVAPDFNMQDIWGNEVSLEDLRANMF
jgi:hypothetical protein